MLRNDSDCAQVRISDEDFMRLIGLPQDTPSLHTEVVAGLSYNVVPAFAKAVGMSPKGLAALAGMSESTLKRRAKAGKLNLLEGDRVARLASSYAHALSLFAGHGADAWAWLNKPAMGLGGEKPVDMLRTSVGTMMVSDLMFRIEHGVFT